MLTACHPSCSSNIAIGLVPHKSDNCRKRRGAADHGVWLGGDWTEGQLV